MYCHTCLKPAAISSGTASRINEAKNIINAIEPPYCHPLGGLASGSLINSNCGGGGGTRTPKRLRAAVFKTADLPISLHLHNLPQTIYPTLPDRSTGKTDAGC